MPQDQKSKEYSLVSELGASVDKLKELDYSPSVELAQSLVSAARRALAVAQGPQEMGDIKKRLSTIEHWFKLQRASLVESNLVVAERLRTERAIGNWISENIKAGQPKKELSHHGIILSDVGITSSDSARWQAIAGISPDDFEMWINENINTTEISTTGALRLAKLITRLHEVADIASAEITELPPGGFDVIVIDPPWPYGTKYNPDGRRAASPYPEMELYELDALHIPASDDAILWLWTTHAYMRHSFALLDRWGFRDVSIVTWDKQRIGLGYWLRSQTEFCIMAIKGKPKVNLTNESTIIRAKAREHSRKPEEFYSMVERLCGGQRRLDYFSREARPGWHQLGNEPERFSEDNNNE